MTDTKEITLKEHVEKLFGLKVEGLRREIDIRLHAQTSAIEEAKRIMENRMAGFPSEFVRKGDSDVAITEVKARMSTLEEKLEDAKTEVIRKTELARVTIEEKTTSVREYFSLQLKMLEAKVQEAEVIQANIYGRILGTGSVIALVLVVVQILIHVFWGK